MELGTALVVVAVLYMRVAVSCAQAGAPVVEVHLRLPDVECEDADFSYTPEQMAKLVRAIKCASVLAYDVSS